MDKTRLEILRSICKGGIISSMLTHEQALEAMKIAMKQAWFACANQEGQANYEMQMQLCDEYLNKLEEGK